MNEGRAELQRVVQRYEKQRAEAIRSKQEAEIVLPFVRAAIEELDAAQGQPIMDEEHTPASKKLALERSAAFVKEHESKATDEADNAGSRESRKASFSRSSIASLIDDDGKDSQKAG